MRITTFTKLKRARKHGFRNRLKTKSGLNLLKRRRLKKRARLTVTNEHR